MMQGKDNELYTTWVRDGGRIKNQWVTAVVVFWVTVAIQAVVYFYQGKLNFILISIAGGMMVLAIWLKVRFQLHSRREPQNKQ